MPDVRASLSPPPPGEAATPRLRPAETARPLPERHSRMSSSEALPGAFAPPSARCAFSVRDRCDWPVACRICLGSRKGLLPLGRLHGIRGGWVLHPGLSRDDLALSGCAL